MSRPAFTLWLEYECFIPEPDRPFDPANEMSNLLVTLPDGRKYAYSCSTYRFVETARAMERAQGDNLGGLFSFAPDLLVESLDRPTLERIVAHMVENDMLCEDKRVPPEIDEIFAEEMARLRSGDAGPQEPA